MYELNEEWQSLKKITPTLKSPLRWQSELFAWSPKVSRSIELPRHKNCKGVLSPVSCSVLLFLELWPYVLVCVECPATWG